MKLIDNTTIEQLTDIFNTTIQNKLPYKLGISILNPVQKHNKPKIVENTRPIILVSESIETSS